ncbi:dihydroxy-acid dehydratase [compost metagenome]
MDVEKRSIELLVSAAELATRREALPQPEPRFGRGYGWMFAQHILQADKGCDFDFLESGFGETAGEPAIF